MDEQEKEINEVIESIVESKEPILNLAEEIIIPRKPITSEEWKANVLNERLLTLPSGITFKVKNVPFSKLICTGTFPLPLLNSLFKTSEKIQDVPSEQIMDNISPSELQALDEMLSRFAVFAVIEPKVIFGEVSIERAIPAGEIDFFDRMFLITSCMGGNALQYKEFFREQNISKST